jgi:DnaJ-class molecular chaperone
MSDTANSTNSTWYIHTGNVRFEGFTIHVEGVRFAPPPPPPPPPRRYTPTAYIVLGLPPGAGPEIVKRRYRQLAKLAHPDLGGDAGWMKVLNLAYDALRGTR